MVIIVINKCVLTCFVDGSEQRQKRWIGARLVGSWCRRRARLRWLMCLGRGSVRRLLRRRGGMRSISAGWMRISRKRRGLVVPGLLRNTTTGSGRCAGFLFNARGSRQLLRRARGGGVRDAPRQNHVPHRVRRICPRSTVSLHDLISRRHRLARAVSAVSATSRAVDEPWQSVRIVVSVVRHGG